MKTLNNYILERLNPRNLGNVPELIDGEVCYLGKVNWNIYTKSKNITIKGKNWYCGVVLDKQLDYGTTKTTHKFLVFWSPESEYVIHITHYSVTKDSPEDYAWSVVKDSSVHDAEKFYQEISDGGYIDFVKSKVKSKNEIHPDKGIEYSYIVTEMLNQFKKMPAV